MHIASYISSLFRNPTLLFWGCCVSIVEERSGYSVIPLTLLIINYVHHSAIHASQFLYIYFKYRTVYFPYSMCIVVGIGLLPFTMSIRKYLLRLLCIRDQVMHCSCPDR